MSVQRVDVQQHLERILDEEARLLAELELVLRRETEILGGEDSDAIQNIGANRHRCVERLTRLDAERADSCRMLSFGSGPGALDKLLAWADVSGALRAQWNSNLALVRRCKRLNDQNGAIVAARLNRVQLLLGKLRGSSPPPVYSARGARYGSLAPRELGRA
jgi:flagellar biosynthesis/type III secretory pathway chaperone